MILRKPAALAAAFLFASAAFAGPAEDGLGQCAAVSDGTARLACYDKLAASLRPAPVADAAPAAAPADPAVAAAPAPASAPTADSPAWYDPSGWFADSVNPNAQVRPEQFGSESLPPASAKPGEAAPPAPLDHITAKVVDVAYNGLGRFTVFLENGQIWKQIPGDYDKARFPRKDSFEVTISRGFAGSYNLHVEDRSRVYKVQRVK